MLYARVVHNSIYSVIIYIICIDIPCIDTYIYVIIYNQTILWWLFFKKYRREYYEPYQLVLRDREVFILNFVIVHRYKKYTFKDKIIIIFKFDLISLSSSFLLDTTRNIRNRTN